MISCLMHPILANYLGSTLPVETLARRLQTLVKPYHELSTERYKSMNEGAKELNALRYAFQRCLRGDVPQGMTVVEHMNCKTFLNNE